MKQINLYQTIFTNKKFLHKLKPIGYKVKIVWNKLIWFSSEIKLYLLIDLYSLAPRGQP